MPPGSEVNLSNPWSTRSLAPATISRMDPNDLPAWIALLNDRGRGIAAGMNLLELDEKRLELRRKTESLPEEQEDRA